MVRDMEMTAGQHLRLARHSVRPKITQTHVADELGVSLYTVYNFERGITEYISLEQCLAAVERIKERRRVGGASR